jgi:Restriction endonuclease
MSEKKWESYEEVATYLLNQFAEKFELGRFEGKQITPGESGTDWEIDAKGYSADESHFVVVECKRYTKGRVSQAITGSLAWVIKDTGASNGILVSPFGLQEGAKKIASMAGIHEVILDKDSTNTNYVLSFLNQVCLGFSETADLNITETLSISVIDKDGNVIETRNI